MKRKLKEIFFSSILFGGISLPAFAISSTPSRDHRILALSPAAVTTLRLLNAEKSIVGTGEKAESLSHNPPVVSGFQFFKYELASSLNPTLVVGTQGTTPEDLRQFFKRRAWSYVEIPSGQADLVRESISKLYVQIHGRPLDQEIRDLMSISLTCKKLKPLVNKMAGELFLVIQWNPPMVAGTRSIMGSVWKECGANVPTEGEFVRINMEKILSNPRSKVIDFSFDRKFRPNRVKTQLILETNDPRATLPGLGFWEWIHAGTP